jgi:hypothetical protein
MTLAAVDNVEWILDQVCELNSVPSEEMDHTAAEELKAVKTTDGFEQCPLIDDDDWIPISDHSVFK